MPDGYCGSFRVEAFTSVSTGAESAKFGIIKDSLEKFFSIKFDYSKIYTVLGEWTGYLVEKAKVNSCELHLSSKFVQHASVGKFGDLDYIDLEFGVSRDAHSTLRFSLKVSVEGFNACPCTMGYTSEILGIKKDSKGGVFSVTHNQRTRLSATLTSSIPFSVNFRKLAGRLRESMGGHLLEKGTDLEEARIVIDAHKNSRLIEDAVREAAVGISAEQGIDSETNLRVEGTSLESIHHHDAYAIMDLKISELRSLLD